MFHVLLDFGDSDTIPLQGHLNARPAPNWLIVHHHNSIPRESSCIRSTVSKKQKMVKKIKSATEYEDAVAATPVVLVDLYADWYVERRSFHV